MFLLLFSFPAWRLEFCSLTSLRLPSVCFDHLQEVSLWSLIPAGAFWFLLWACSAAAPSQKAIGTFLLAAGYPIAGLLTRPIQRAGQESIAKRSRSPWEQLGTGAGVSVLCNVYSWRLRPGWSLGCGGEVGGQRVRPWDSLWETGCTMSELR